MDTLDTKTRVFRPGQVWLDSDHNPINAHGGGMLYHEGTYYWYGEYKGTPTYYDGEWDRADVVGVSCYSSSDLHTWCFQGLALEARPDDPSSDLHPSRIVERPKVAWCKQTGQFVMWVHIDDARYRTGKAGVATSDAPTGPFTYVGSVKPEGQDSRDQTLFVDDDGSAYRIYSSEDNATTYISLLTQDYLAHSGRYVRVFESRSMEAQAVFKRKGRYYMVASGCSGWDPNEARSAVADSIWGPWTELGNPCVGPNAANTFGAQSAFVFPAGGHDDAFILMADRWNRADLRASTYVWLPIRFEGGKPRVHWLPEWDLGLFGPQR